MNGSADHNGVGQANKQGLGQIDDEPHFDRSSMLGNLHQGYDDEPAPPLLWFHSVPEAWVSQQHMRAMPALLAALDP